MIFAEDIIFADDSMLPMHPLHAHALLFLFDLWLLQLEIAHEAKMVRYDFLKTRLLISLVIMIVEFIDLFLAVRVVFNT